MWPACISPIPITRLNAVLTDLYQNALIDDADDLAHDIINQFAQVEPIYRHTPPARPLCAARLDHPVGTVRDLFLSILYQARSLMDDGIGMSSPVRCIAA